MDCHIVVWVSIIGEGEIIFHARFDLYQPAALLFLSIMDVIILR